MRHICVFAAEQHKHTKGALRYMQVQEIQQENDNSEVVEVKMDHEGSRDDQGLIGTVYLRKKNVKGPNQEPQRVTIIVEY